MLNKDEADALHALSESLKAVRDEMRRDRGITSRSNVSVQNGAPMWVCVVIVAGSLGYAFSKDGDRSDVIVQQQAQIMRLEHKLDRVEDYQLTTYMLVPDLRKLVEQKANKKEIK